MEESIDRGQSIHINTVSHVPYLIMSTESEIFSLSGELETQSCGNYDRTVVDELWESMEKIRGNDSAMWRRDERGALVCRSEYGNKYSSYGWEIIETSPGMYQMNGVSPGRLLPLHFDSI